MDRKKKKKITALFTAASILMSCFSVYAFGPDDIRNDIGEENMARLMDGQVEWDEIGALVKYYNPTYRQYADQADVFIGEMQNGKENDAEAVQSSLDMIDEQLDQVKTQRKELSRLPGDMIIDQHGTTVAQSLAMLDEGERTLKASRKSALKGLGQLSSLVKKMTDTYEDSLKPVREQLTKVLQGLLITYEELMINRRMVEKQVNLYETALQTRKQMRDASLASDVEVREAEAQLLEAKVTLGTIDNGILELRRAIGLQTGYGPEVPPEIGSVPIPDPAKYDAIDAEADRTKALDNSAALENAGNVKNYPGTGAVSVKDREENLKRAELSGNFDRILASLQAQKLLYASSQTSLRRAELTRNQAKRQYELGLLGRTEYEARELEYLSYEAAAANAALSFAQAANDYEWALKGYLD